jgi:hypothetical protein
MALIPDFSIGFTEAEVLAILAVQKAELLKTMQQWGEGGSMAIKRHLDEVNTIIALCQRALHRFNPDTYGKAQAVGQSSMSPFFAK